MEDIQGNDHYQGLEDAPENQPKERRGELVEYDEQAKRVELTQLNKKRTNDSMHTALRMWFVQRLS